MGSYPVLRTWTAGEIVTAAYMNANIRDAGNFFLSVPVFEGRQTSSQSIPNATATAITLDTEDVDTDNGHSTSTNTGRYTAQTAGRFQVSGAISFTANATGRRNAIINVNAATVNAGEVDSMAVTNGQPTIAAARTMTVFLNGTGDFVWLTAYQDSGSALSTNVSINTWQPSMSVRWVGTT